MNYLTHGFQFLDQPMFLAGTAVPDWLRVSDPRVRVRPKLTEAVAGAHSSDPEFQELCHGILRHHADDDRFHSSVVFQQVSEDLAKSFRKIMRDRYDHRPGLLGHIVAELLLDNELARRNPGLLHGYYAALDTVDSVWIHTAVNRIVRRPAGSLAHFIDVFREVRFLYDYADNSTLWHRLNQVLQRAKLSPLPEDVFPIFDDARDLLQQRGTELLESISTPEVFRS